MSRPITISQLLLRAGLGLKRPRSDRRSAAEKALGDARNDADSSGTEAKRSKLMDNSEVKDAISSDVDGRIAALERELEGGSISGSDDDDQSMTDSEGEVAGSMVKTIARQSACGRSDNAVVKLVSPLEADKIEPLPAHLLPRPGCGISKSKTSTKKSAKRSQTVAGEYPQPLKGLDSAVKELLDNYEARSSERVPFYCRVCKFQGDSLDELESHKREPLHVEATKKERKLSRCSLCKKQFTSPPQLKEHLAGKAHLERLQAVMSCQGKWAKHRGVGSQSRGESEPGRGVSQVRGRNSGGSRGRGLTRHGNGKVEQAKERIIAPSR